jgi:hypothetical protein
MASKDLSVNQGPDEVPETYGAERNRTNYFLVFFEPAVNTCSDQH